VIEAPATQGARARVSIATTSGSRRATRASPSRATPLRDRAGGWIRYVRGRPAAQLVTRLVLEFDPLDEYPIHHIPHPDAVFGGRNPEATQKFHNAQREPKVAFVVDDVLPPWKPRCVMVRGTAETIPAGGDPTGGAIIRITPEKIVNWGLDDHG
jgi:PPOX class F420-dependent enzyme/OxyR family protein